MPSRSATAPSGIFYGWWVTAAFAVMVFTSAGVRHAVGPFLKPMVADLGVDRGAFSLVIALGLLLYGLYMPWVGTLVDRLGARLVTTAGAILFALSLMATGFCQNLWQLALVYGAIASLGLAATGPVVANAVVSRWFHKKRGTAVSLLGSASMSGMSLLVPVLAWLIVTVGWRMTYVTIGMFVLAVMLPMCWFLVRESPESMGLAADGDPVPEDHTAAAFLERTPVSEAARTLAFWQLAGTFLTCGFSMSLLSAHGVPMLTDHGYTPIFASWAFGILGGSSILTTMLLGAASDRYGRRPVLAGIYAGRALVFAGFFLIRDSHVAIIAVAVLGGITMAGTMSMTSALTADIYGRHSIGGVLGVIFLVHQIGAAVGSWMAGALFDATGGYGAAFTIAGAVLVCAALASLRIDDGRRMVPWMVRSAAT
jgi:MFS family permease